MKIKQIMAAGDWFAVGVYDYDEEPAGDLFYVDPLVAWAVVEEEGSDDRIVGMIEADGYVDSAEQSNDFFVYVHKSDITDRAKARWTKEAQRRHAKKSKLR